MQYWPSGGEEKCLCMMDFPSSVPYICKSDNQRCCTSSQAIVLHLLLFAIELNCICQKPYFSHVLGIDVAQGAQLNKNSIESYEK